MKLTAIYTKLDDGRIQTYIKVDEMGDYPTNEIFSSTNGILPIEKPDGEVETFDTIEYALEERDSHECQWYYSTPEVAKEAVKIAIAYLSDKLNEWRNVKLPHSETFDI